MHPYRLLHEVSGSLEPDAAVVADGGDILSFANAAALLAPGRQVVAVIGDGS